MRSRWRTTTADCGPFAPWPFSGRALFHLPVALHLYVKHNVRTRARIPPDARCPLSANTVRERESAQWMDTRPE